MASSSPAPGPPSYRRKQSDDLLGSSSDSSQVTTLSARRVYTQNGKSPALTPIETSSQNLSRPPPIRAVNDPSRVASPTADSPSTFGSHFGHRRQRSQGYFEPTLSSNAPSTPIMSNLTASQIAAQAAMHTQSSQHSRKRSETIPGPGGIPAGRGQTSPPPIPVVDFSNRSNNPSAQYQNGLVGGYRAAATTAANAAFPRSPIPSPGLSGNADYHQSEKELKPVKEKSKMKLFSKPKNIGISRDKDSDRKQPPLPSPGKTPMQSSTALNRLMMNSSTTSLVDPTMSSASSLYSSANASTSTLVPLDKIQSLAPEKEKEKHKHHFLSRQKNKLKDKDDHYNLPLSSVNSNSRPTDPAMPQPLYSFAPAPASPGHTSSFGTGLDLRHGGRALRQKKKEEKAAALAPYGVDISEPSLRERGQSFQTDRSEWPGPSSLGASSAVPSPGPMTLTYAGDLAALGHAFGLSGLTPDDAWPLLKARLLNIFEGEDPRPPIEDFNGLVSVHIRRCMQKRAPTILIDDLNELLQTGFSSLDQTLRHIPDDRLITHLVELWISVFTTILPFLQAVFLPLDLEFKGHGPLMSAREAADFWGAALPESKASSNDRHVPTLGEDLDVRRIILLTFRDTVVLPRHDTLMAIFSRLSLESLSGGIVSHPTTPNIPEHTRPGTSGSAEAALSSFNSQSTTLLDTTSNASSIGVRSRATSNTSAGSFASVGQQSPRPMRRVRLQPAEITETVGRMLQCVSVLAAAQSGDESQSKTERLTKELKYNWLGRGRTGRQRRGFVGPRVPRGVPVGGAG